MTIQSFEKVTVMGAGAVGCYFGAGDDILGVAAGCQGLERGSAFLPPGGEVRVHAGDEGGELGVLVDGRLDGRFLHSKVEVADKLEFSIPELEEQTAIAEVLSDMDAEIAVLEARLAKARSLKQGMMQELLTGRIRLA